MTRHLDRARGILSLILIAFCLTLYAGYLIKTDSTVLDLYIESSVLFDSDMEEDLILEIASEIKLVEVIDSLNQITDLSWIEDDEAIIQEINSRIGMQGRNFALSQWLEEQQEDNVQGVEVTELPPMFFNLFEYEPKTLKARQLAAQLQEKYDMFKNTVGVIGSVLNFHEAVDPKLNLYGLNISLSASSSLLVLVISSGILSLYLFSLLGAISYEIEYLEVREGTDLILFHPGRLSLVLSFFWIFSPVLGALYNYFTIKNIYPLVLLCTVIVLALIVITYLKTIECRRLLFQKLPTLK